MKATGIVRRIDDLGRVVIPKEIRRTLRIREGDPLEIFVARDGEVILKKYSPISELGDFATDYADSLFTTLHVPTLICDRDEVIAVAGKSKKDYLNKEISPFVSEVIEKRVTKMSTEKENVALIHHLEEEISAYCIIPIIANGDPIGCVIALAKEDGHLSEIEEKVMESAANFLAKQME